MRPRFRLSASLPRSVSVLLAAVGAAGACGPSAPIDGSQVDKRASALVGAALVTIEQNGYLGAICVFGQDCAAPAPPVPPSRSWDLPAGDHIITANSFDLVTDTFALGSINITAGGAVTLRGTASKFFTITTSSRAATLRAKVKPVTMDCNGYGMCYFGLYVGGVGLWVEQGAQQKTVPLIPERRYQIFDQWSRGSDEFGQFGNFALSVLADGSVTINDAVARASFTTSGSTFKAITTTLTIDYKGYETQFNNSLPDVIFAGWDSAQNTTDGIGNSIKLIRGRRYLMGEDTSLDPVTGNWSFSDWMLGGDVTISASGAVSLGPDSSRHMSVIGAAALAPRLGYVRIERGGYSGTLCLNHVDLSCAPANADLQAALILGRDYLADDGFAFGTPHVRVNANGSCGAASVALGGTTLAVRCGLSPPPPGATIPPPVAMGLTGFQAGPGRVDLAWSDVAGETGYRVQRSSDGTNFVDLQELPAGATTYSDGGAVEGATNHYRVIAFNVVGPSAPSNVVAVAVTAPAPCGGVNNPCPDPAVTQFNHNTPRIDYRGELVPTLTGDLPIKGLVTDAGNGELPAPPPTVSCVGSRVDDLRWSFSQDSADFTTGSGPTDVGSCGAAASEAGRLPSLQLRRYHRPRLEHMLSSFGPGVFSNFDAKLALHGTGIDGHPDAVFFNPETDAPPLTLFERSAADGDSADDGLFRDKETRTWRQLVLYTGTTPNASSRAASIFQATLAVLEAHDGGAIWFEMIRTNPGNPDLIDARPVAYLDRNGNRFNVQYQFARNATDSALNFDRSQLWKIAKVVDVLHGHEVTFAYERRFATARWLVKTVTSRLPDGTSRPYAYRYSDAGGAVDTLVEVEYPNGDKSQFSKTFNAATQLWGLTYDDVALGNSKLRKTVWVTGPVFRTPDGTVHPQTMNLVRRVVNGNQEEVLRLAEDPNDPNVTFVVEGARRLTRLTTDGQGAPRQVARARAVAADPRAATYDVLGTYDANAQGMITKVTDAAGKVRTLTRDSQTRRITGLAARDGTTASWAFNALGKPTRQVDRLGRATDATYDSRGNPLTMTMAPGSPLQATARFTYNAAGQVLTEQDVLGRITNYGYDTHGYLTSVMEAPDTTGAPRATTVLEMGAFGLQTAKADASGRRTTFQYDARNRLTTTTFPDGTTETVTYGTGSLAGMVVARKDRNGTVETYEHDATRRVTKRISASNRAEKIAEVFEYVPGTELLSAVTRAGERTEYSYDERNREISKRRHATNGKVLVSQRQYDTSDRLTTEIDPYGRRTLYLHDVTDRVVRLVRELVPGGVPAGASLGTLARITGGNPPYTIEDRSHDGMGQPLSKTDGRGVTTTYTHDLRGRKTQQVEAAGTTNARTTGYEYDLAGNLTKETLPRTLREGRPFVRTYSYTGRQLLAARIEAAGAPETATTSFTYTPTRKIATETNPRGGVTTTTYDNNDRVATIKDAAGFVATSGYDGVGNETSETDPLGRATTQTYDGLGRLLSQTNAVGETTTFQYDDDLVDGVGLDVTFAAHVSGLGFGANANGMAMLVTNPAGDQTFEVYDGLERRVLSLDPNAGGTKIAHDAVVGGLVELSITSPLGHTGKVRWDGAGNERATVDQAGNATSRSFDASGNPLTSRDPNGVGEDCAYNELGQKVSCTDTQGDQTSYEYDAANNVVAVTDAALARTSCTYDTLDRKASCTDALGATSSWSYDKSGNLTKVIDGQGGVTTYTYDQRNLRTSATLPDSSGSTDKLTWAYDAAGQLISRTLQNGNVITLAYDGAGRLIRRGFPDALNDTYNYDLGSRMKTASSARYGTTVTWTYDRGGRITKESLAFQGKSYDVSQSYDAGNRGTSLRYPDATELLRTFTERDQIASLSLGSRAIASYAYDAGDRLTTTTFGNGLVERRSYRADNLVSTIDTPGVGDFGYTYDKVKRKLAESGTASPGGTQSFSYDKNGRPISWAHGSSTQSWTLSAEGDWTRTVRGTTVENRTHNAAHELTAIGATALTYDSRGNLTKNDKGHTYSWDRLNQLQTFTKTSGSTTTTATLFYDALGRRVAKTVAVSGSSTTTTVSVHFGQEVVAEQVNGVLTRKYILGPGSDHRVAQVNGSDISWFSLNHLGTLVAATDAAAAIKERYRYTAFGERTVVSAAGATLASSIIGNQFGFTGQYHDQDTEVMDFRARQYDPRLGRFLSRDDAYRDGLNLYMAYFAPNFTDPTGHFSLKKFVSKVGSAIAGAAEKVGEKIAAAATSPAGRWVIRTGIQIGVTALATTILGPWPGSIVGGFVGGALGEMVDRALRGDDFNFKDVLIEDVLIGGFLGAFTNWAADVLVGRPGVGLTNLKLHELKRWLEAKALAGLWPRPKDIRAALGKICSGCVSKPYQPDTDRHGNTVVPTPHPYPLTVACPVN